MALLGISNEEVVLSFKELGIMPSNTGYRTKAPKRITRVITYLLLNVNVNYTLCLTTAVVNGCSVMQP